MTYLVKRQGSDELPVKVHVDDLNRFKRFDTGPEIAEDSGYEDSDSDSDFDPEDPEPEGVGKQAKKVPKAKHVVKQIMDERGKETASHHDFLVHWGGTDKKGVPWKCSWQPQDNLDCSTAIMEWEMATAHEKGRKRTRAAKLGIMTVSVEVGRAKRPEGPAPDSVAAERVDAPDSRRRPGRVIPIEVDVHKLAMQPGESVVQQICTLAGIQMAEVLLVWASTPCETYTSLDYTHSSRGTHYREHGSATREPRSVESCVTEDDFVKRRKAIRHDQLTEGVVRSFRRDNHRRRNYAFCLENPVGMLAERPFMTVTDWLSLGVRRVVNYCNYGGRFLKPTHVWSSLRQWIPGGESGCGRCNEQCSAGSWNWVPSSRRKVGVRYAHDEHIGGPTSKTVQGLGPKKHQRWHVPAPLLEEVLSVAREEAKDEPRRRYVIDICAGRGSWLEVVQQQGLDYVPVDIDISAFADYATCAQLEQAKGRSSG